MSVCTLCNFSTNLVGRDWCRYRNAARSLYWHTMKSGRRTWGRETIYTGALQRVKPHIREIRSAYPIYSATYVYNTYLPMQWDSGVIWTFRLRQQKLLKEHLAALSFVVADLFTFSTLRSIIIFFNHCFCPPKNPPRIWNDRSCTNRHLDFFFPEGIKLVLHQWYRN